MRTFFLIFLMGLSAFSPVIGDPQRITIADFSGGLNLAVDVNKLQPNESLIFRNCYWDGQQLVKRQAFTKMNTKFSSSGIRNFYRYYNGRSKQTQLVAISGSSMYISANNGLTWTMPYAGTSNVTVTSGSKMVIAPDSGYFRHHRDRYFSAWNMSLTAGIFAVNRFGISASAAPDTAVLEIAYSGGSGSSAWQLSPKISESYVDFETWLFNLYIADGLNPIKVWDGATFRAENAKRYFLPLDSFKTVGALAPSPYQKRGVTFPTLTADFTKADAYFYGYYNYSIVFSDSVGVGDTVAKPIPIWQFNGAAFFLLGLDRYDIDTSKWVYVTYPINRDFLEFTVLDSGVFERRVVVSQHTSGSIADTTYDFVDDNKTFTSLQYNSSATFVTFKSPYASGTCWYTFRNHKRATAPDTVSIRITMHNLGDCDLNSTAFHPPSTYTGDYWIIRGQYGSRELMPASRFVRQQGDALWAAGFADAPNEVSISEAGTDSVWGDDIFAVHGEDGDEITGIFDIYNYLYFMKSDQIVQVTGNAVDNIAQSPTLYDFGMKSPQSFFRHGSNFVGFNDLGFFIFQGGNSTVLSDKMYPVIRDSINVSQWSLIDGQDAGRFFVVSAPFTGSTVNNRTFAADLGTGGWSEWTGLRVGSWLQNDNIATPDTLMYGDADSGVVYLYGRTINDAYDLDYCSGFMDFGDAGVEKNVGQVRLEGAWDSGDTMQIFFYVNQDLTQAVDTLNFISTSSTITRNYYGDCSGAARGSSIAVRVKSLSVDRVTISGVGFEVSQVRTIRP